MNAVARFLAAEIARQGAIPFAQFMATALYCPILGYYEQIRHTPGRHGDYFTSVSVGPLFGRLLARQFTDWARERHARRRPPPFRWQIVEAGAHDGRLAQDVLEALTHLDRSTLPPVDYIILEPSAQRQQWQHDTLRHHARHVRWIRDWSDLSPPGVEGVIFANELLDALPARRLGWNPACATWFEWGVRRTGDAFDWTRLPIHPELSPPVQTWLDDLATACSSHWTDGHTVEAPESALAWWTAAARSLHCGHLVTIDYGLDAAAWGLPARRHGTLRAYDQHHCSDAILAHPGEQDITLHVNWDLVRHAGEAEGLSTLLQLPQGRWLSGVLARLIAAQPEPTPWSPAELRQFQTLSHPDQMGARFQILAQTREPIIR